MILDMHMFHVIADKLYSHICSYLPWGYNDLEENTALSVEELPGGDLRVTTVKGGVAVENAIHIVVVPKQEIQRLLSK